LHSINFQASVSFKIDGGASENIELGQLGLVTCRLCTRISNLYIGNRTQR
jgi:hypothetical protein